MKTLDDIINWVLDSGYLFLMFYIIVVVGKPYVDSKIKHAETVQEKEAWMLLEQVSMTAVNARIGKPMTGQEKFVDASSAVQAYLKNKGINIDMKQVQAAVQSAYEKSPLTPATNQEEKADKLGLKASDYIPDGKAEAIDPKEVV